MNDFELNLNTKLEDNLKYLLYNNLSNYYNTNLINVLEEKEEIIKQLKQSVVDLTDKRFRALNNATTNGQITAALPQLSQHNIEFLLNEKEKQIQDLKNDLNGQENEIKNLKKTIKEQDDVILQLNNNIFELKNNNETVLRAKQDSFRLMNEESVRKQKLIDDQNAVIKSLKEKIEYLEEDYSKSRVETERRLNEKDNELRVKIASFEANLYQGKQYFEEVLNEKNQVLKEKMDEINNLKKKLNENDQEDDDENSESLVIEPKSSSSSFNDTSASASFIKFESDTIKNMKALYEHQIDILKVKIEMLEKTCLNYQQGIKEMNSSFGYKQQNDEMVSIQVFKEIMQDTQKKNAQLETECIELQVKAGRYKKELEDISIEKDNLNKKAFNLDNQLNRLLNEKIEYENYYKKQFDLKANEINSLISELNMIKDENLKLLNENVYLNQVSNEHDELKIQHSQLMAHYEQLYQHSTDIVNGNQILNDENHSHKLTIEDLENKLSDLNIKLDQLEWSNSELNTKKINLDLKCADLEEKMVDFEKNLSELDEFRKVKLEFEELKRKFEDLKAELNEKNELIDQLNQAKEFLAENNSKLLTNNIKIQLFLESMGLENHQSLIETNLHVKEFDDIKEQLHNVSIELNELKFKFKQAELNIIEKDNELIKLNMSLNKLNSKLDAFTQTENEFQLTEEEVKDEPINNAEHQELIIKCQKLEEQNIKYKAKLKQLINSNKISTAQVNSSTTSESQTDLSQLDLDNLFSKCSDLEQDLLKRVQEYESKTDDLVNYGAILGCEKLKEHTLNELSSLNEYVNQTLTQFRTLKHDYDNLMNDKNQVEQRLNSVIQSLNNDLNEKVKLIDELKDSSTSTSNIDQTQLFNLKIENSNLNTELESLKVRLSELEENKSINCNEINEMKNEIFNLNEEIKTRLDQISQLEMDNSIIQNENQYNLEQLEQLKAKLNEVDIKNTSNNEELIAFLKNENSNLQSELDSIKLKLTNELINNEELFNFKNEIEKLNQLIQEKCEQIHRLETDNSILQNENQYNLEENKKSKSDSSEHLNLENRQNELNSKLSIDFEKNEKQIEELKCEVTNLNVLVQDKLDQISQLETENLLLQNENESLQTKLANLETSQEYESLLNEKQSIQTQMENLKQLFNQENDDLRVEISKLTDLIENKIERINELEAKNSILENDLSQSRQISSPNENDELKNKISQLENQNLKYKAKLKQLLGSSNNKEKLETENIQKSSAQTVTAMSHSNNNEEELNRLQEENSNLAKKLDELKLIINELELEKSNLQNQLVLLQQKEESLLNDSQMLLNDKDSELIRLKEENSNLTTKLTSMEQMSLKYKAKLKQVLKQQQQTSTGNQLHVSLLEEQRSNNSTPTPPFMSPIPCPINAEVQTDLLMNDINQTKDQDINTSGVDQDEFEKIKQQNIKLKAKVKQLISNANLKQPSSDSIIDSHQIDENLKQIEELTQEINRLKYSENDLIKEKTNLQNKLDELNIKLAEMENNENLNMLKIEELNLEISRLSIQSNLVEEYANQIDGLKIEINRLKSSESDLNSEKLNLQSKLDEISARLTESDLVQSNSTLQSEQLENYLKQIDELTSELNRLKSNEFDYNQQIINLKQSFQIEINNLNELINTKSKDMLSRLDAKEKKIVQLNLKLGELEQQNEYENYVSQNGSACSSLGIDNQQRTSLQSVDSSKYNHLEAQLKYCSEKCEKVVAKLNQLKSHNESLNNKIKSIKSMVIA